MPQKRDQVLLVWVPVACVRLNLVPLQYSNILPGRKQKKKKLRSKHFYLRVRLKSPGIFARFILKEMSTGGGNVMFVGGLRLNTP